MARSKRVRPRFETEPGLAMHWQQRILHRLLNDYAIDQNDPRKWERLAWALAAERLPAPSPLKRGRKRIYTDRSLNALAVFVDATKAFVEQRLGRDLNDREALVVFLGLLRRQGWNLPLHRVSPRTVQNQLSRARRMKR